MSRSLRRPGQVSLARALSKLGLASRAEAGRLIADGRVTVDGRVIRQPSMPVVPERARLKIDGAGRPARGPEPRRVLLLHKPRGTVTTRRDPEGRRTVFDVLGEAARGLVAVGRLDAASTGLLVFTNDTQLAHRLTDPSRRVPRRYVVTVRGRVTAETAQRIERGLMVPGARPGAPREQLAASCVEIRKASGRETHLIVELTEGRNRELRRLFGAVGHEPTRIHRISFGEYELGDLLPGEWRET
jgi:23S rRNA pseudouridine2605 synthase